MHDVDEIKRKENELLFFLQGISREKTIKGEKVFVKLEGADDCIKDIIRLLKHESNAWPIYRKTAGKWNVLT